MKNKTKFLILIFIIALFIRVSFIFVTPLKYWDETVYANLGYDLSKNPFDYSFRNNGWSDFIPYSNGNYSWPNAGFRPPLLPYLISLFYFLKIDFLIDFLIPLIGAFSVILVYFIGEKFFNERVGLYSALLFCFIPLHVIYSAKLLTDVLFVFLLLLIILFFWMGFEENKNKYKFLFGLFLGLCILCRYNGLWLVGIFGIYLIIRNKGFKFLKDNHFWISFLILILVLSPLFIYSFYTYGNIFGSFIHGSSASSYWGGLQDFAFYFHNWYDMFSVIFYLFLISTFFIFYKKFYLKKEIYFLILFFILFFILISLMPHKEDRLILPLTIIISLFCGFFLNSFKKLGLLILILVLIFTSFYLYNYFVTNSAKSYTDENLCFLRANDFLRNVNGIVISDESSPIYYYSKKENHFYPNPWNMSTFNDLIKNNYSPQRVYILFSPNKQYSNIDSEHLKKDLDNIGNLVFICKNNSRVYKINI